MKIAVIGAGLGGLTFGALAASDKHEVTVFDKNPQVGGVCALARKNGYCWEQGPLLLCGLYPDEPLGKLLGKLGISLPMVRACRGTELPDYKMWRPAEYAGRYWRRERLKELFPADSAGIDEYYRIYDRMMLIRALSAELDDRPSIFKKLKLALTFLPLKKYASLSAKQLTEKLFSDEKLRTLYTGILADFCCAPSEFQGLGLPFVNIETAYDDRIPIFSRGHRAGAEFGYVEGGVQKLPEALAKVITDNGGSLRLSATVSRVRVENGRAVGVELDGGEFFAADIVVGSGGARETFGRLVGLEHLDAEYKKQLDTFRPMEAVFMVHLGLDCDPLDYMQESLCYYYGGYDLETMVGRLRSGVYHNGEDGYLLFVPSAHAPEFAPEGRHCLTVYTVAPDTLKDSDWASKKEEYADRLIELASRQIPELEKHITEKLIVTAEDYRAFTHLEHSAFGGTVPIMGVTNPRHVTPVAGLYFVGQQSENGGGVDAVALGAKAAYLKMKKREGLN